MPCSVDAGTGLPQEMVPEPAHDAGIDADAAHFHPDYSNEQDLAASGGNDDAPLAGGPISGECSASNGIDNAPLPADPIRGDCSSSTGVAAPLAGGPNGENFSASMERQPAAAVFTPWVNSASQPPAGLFEVTNGRVKVGEGMFMPLDKWTFIMKNVSDGKCCLELAKHFWAPTEAATRSLTGQACRSMATEVKKLPATPEKVEMVKNCLAKYIDLHPALQPPRDHRVAAVRKYLRTFFTEAACQGKRADGSQRVVCWQHGADCLHGQEEVGHQLIHRGLCPSSPATTTSPSESSPSQPSSESSPNSQDTQSTTSSPARTRSPSPAEHETADLQEKVKPAGQQPPTGHVDSQCLEREEPDEQHPSPKRSKGKKPDRQHPPPAGKARASCVLGPLAPLVEDAFPPLPPQASRPFPSSPNVRLTPRKPSDLRQRGGMQTGRTGSTLEGSTRFSLLLGRQG
ncbi:uncharacterized protein LOC125947232 [Dermacentor silvarum]|uniref:uncharacterized protein LOC125947232 n=1 Tax=Dermacentor silvarum TaxID=543639 RepID=UPI0021011363|nr:uncharacterized protein LOC125947232 [Dermacentor silvarum]